MATPTAAAPPAEAAPAKAGVVPVSSSSEIHIGAAGNATVIPAGGTPPKAPTAKQRMQSELMAKAGIPAKTPPDETLGNSQRPPAAPQKEGDASPPTPPADAESAALPSAGSSTPAEKDGSAAPATTPTPESKDSKPGKVNPWKLVEDYKSKLANTEKDLIETKKLIVDEAARKSEVERLTRAEQRAKELEDEIRFTNYEKSEEFQKKHVEPYKKAWMGAMEDLGDVSVADPNTGEERALTAQDLLELVNMPLGKAKKVAMQTMGDFATDVMERRNKIRELFDAQQTALKEAKEGGAERERQRASQMDVQRKQAQEFIAKTWKQANDNEASHEIYGKYFTPEDGDEEGNTKLSAGYDLVDHALAKTPMAPGLTAQERAEIIHQHAVVRNRAAAFERLVLREQKLLAKNSELETELSQYRRSEPPAAGAAPASSSQVKTSARSQMEAALRKLAH